MDFTHGRRENRFCREEKLEKEKSIYEGSSTGGGDKHPFLPITSSVSSSSSAIFLHCVDGTDVYASPTSSSATALPTSARGVEKEQMFEKVVTPSDVGKLNRLVIPKQHAEKYFPLDATTHDKGLLLNFEDRNGKPWRFRYSYWNSSQSYVMTKGWSRFVKEKRLDAGDTVLFGRGVGDTTSDRLFIDWKRRQDQHLNPLDSLRIPRNPAYNDSTHSTTPSSSSATHHHPYVSFSRSAAKPWAASRLFVPNATPTTTPNYFYLRSAAITTQPQPISGGTACPPAPMVLDSFPVTHGKAGDATKRVRLFGVNLEQPREAAMNPESAGLLRLQFRCPDLHAHEVDSSPSASSSSSSIRGSKASIN